MERIGIFGGSFNPIHSAHCIMAECFVEQLALDQCLFIPAFRSPFKQSSDYCAPEHRLAMVHLATHYHPNFAVDDCEIIRSDTSYFIDTLRHISNKYPSAELFFLIGTDQAKHFNQWYCWKEILALSTACIVQRSSTAGLPDGNAITPIFEDWTTGKPHRTISAPLLNISSTEIRSRIQSGKSIRYRVPEMVELYIAEHKLYEQSE